jgi:hypothetical protein
MSSEMDDGALDRLLAKAVPPGVPPALEQRILADFDRTHAGWSIEGFLRRAADAVWPDAPLWQPAGAFALALLIGVGVAVFVPFDFVRADVPMFAFEGAPDADPGQGI